MLKRFFTSTLGGASILILLVSILTKGVGFIREVIYANNFGLGWEFDIFLVSAALPMIIYTTIIYLGQNYFIPAYNKTKAENKEKVNHFLTENLLMFFLLGLILALILFLASDYILDFYIKDIESARRKTAENIFNIFCFTIPLSASFSILSAFLNAEYKFHYPAFAKLFQNFTVVIILLLLSGAWDIYAIPTAFLAGMTIQLAYLLFLTRKDLKFGIYFFKDLKYLRKLINSTLGLTVIAEFISLSYILIDRYFYHKVDAGGIAALQYAYTLFILPITTISFALSTTLFSKFSQTFSNFQKKELENTFMTGIKVIILIFIPISLIFILDGKEIVQIVYQRGRFTSGGTILTSGVLEIFAMSLVFYASYAIINKLFYSTNMIKQLVIITVGSLVVKLILNIVFVDMFQQKGLAFATAVSYTLLFVVGFYWVLSQNKFDNKAFYWEDLLFYLINGNISYLAAYLLVELITLGEIITFILRTLLFGAIFIINLIYLKVPELKIIEDLIKNFLDKER